MKQREQQALENAAETIKTLRGVVESLKTRIRVLEEENHQIKEALDKMKIGNEIPDYFDERLGIYYRDLCHYNEKNLSDEDGERLYQTLQYVFKELRKWGICR